MSFLKHLSFELHIGLQIPSIGHLSSQARHLGSQVNKSLPGSRTSSSTGFLMAVQPSLGIVSAGKENPFGHPHPEILDRLRAMNIPVINTAEQGTIVLPLTQ